MYAIQFSDGVVKIGVARSPRERIRTHQVKRRKKIVHYLVSPRVDVAKYRAEMHLKDKMAKIFELATKEPQSMEWFSCPSFGQVENLLKQVFKRFYGEQSGWKAIHGIDPWVAMPSGWEQQAKKVGRWAAMSNS